MANHKSALKRARQDIERNMRNKSRKTALKTITKKIDALVTEGALEDAKTTLVAAQKRLDQAAAKKTIHRKTAERKVSRLTRRVNAAASQ